MSESPPQTNSGVGLPEWEVARRLISDAIGEHVELTAEALPLDGSGLRADGLGVQILDARLWPAPAGSPLALQDRVSITCSPIAVVDLGLFIISSILNNRFGSVIVLGASSEDEWQLRVDLLSDHRAHLPPASAVLACFEVSPYEPIPDVDLYVDHSHDGAAAPRPTLVIEGTMAGLCSFAAELVRSASSQTVTESRAEHMLAPAPSSDVRFTVVPLSSPQLPSAEDQAPLEHPQLPAPDQGVQLESLFADESGQWQTLSDYDTLVLALRHVPENVHSGIRIVFSATTARGGVKSLVHLSGTQLELVAFGLWLAGAAAPSGQPSTLTTSNNVTISRSSHGFQDPAGAQLRLALEPADEISNTISIAEPAVVVTRGYRPEIRDFDIAFHQLDFVADITDPASPMTHIGITGLPTELAELAELVMSIAASGVSGPWDLSTAVRSDGLTVEVLSE